MITNDENSKSQIIYFRGHAKSTYMSNGMTVEDAINNLDGSGGVSLKDYYTKEQIDNTFVTNEDLQNILIWKDV